ncbi:hypothetical protein V6N13_033603 [Hibiscus sabdariffa]
MEQLNSIKEDVVSKVIVDPWFSRVRKLVDNCTRLQRILVSNGRLPRINGVLLTIRKFVHFLNYSFDRVSRIFRHFVGKRHLNGGMNDRRRFAIDVEAKQIVFDELRLLIDNGHVVLEGDEETISGDSLLTIDSCDIRNGEVMVIERDSSASMVEGTYMLKKPECKVDFFDMVKDEFL